jgi:hypothetical protein
MGQGYGSLGPSKQATQRTAREIDVCCSAAFPTMISVPNANSVSMTRERKADVPKIGLLYSMKMVMLFPVKNWQGFPKSDKTGLI